MSAALSTTGKTLRYAMLVVTGLFLFLGLWKMPPLDLNLAGKVIGWLVLLAACLQFTVAAILAPRLSDRQPLTGPLMVSQYAGLVFFGGSIYAAVHLEGLTPAQLRLLLMLGINCMAASTLIGIALSHADPAESPEAIKDA